MGRFGRKLTAYTMSALMLFSGMGFSNGIKNVKAADNTGETSQQIEVRECENTKAGSGNVIVELEGMDYTSAQQEMLNRINQVREEACNEGNVPDPRDTDPSDGISFLTPEDYVPLKIGVNSTKVAQIRAAEGSVKFSHTRPKGGYAYTMLLDREAEHAGENLAWKSFDQEEIENNTDYQKAYPNKTLLVISTDTLEKNEVMFKIKLMNTLHNSGLSETKAEEELRGDYPEVEEGTIPPYEEPDEPDPTEPDEPDPIEPDEPNPEDQTTTEG